MCVDMLKDQALAYKEAVVEYRALAMAARASKTSKATSTNILDCLHRRQVSNIFTQLRKVGQAPHYHFCVFFIVMNQMFTMKVIVICCNVVGISFILQVLQLLL